MGFIKFGSRVDLYLPIGTKVDAIFNVIREYIKQSKKILFEGDGYSEALANAYYYMY